MNTNGGSIGMRTGISMQVLLAVIGLVSCALYGGTMLVVRSYAALPREEAAATYETLTTANKEHQELQSQLDRRFGALDATMCRMEEKLDKLLLQGR